MGMTERQAARAELRAATDAYCQARDARPLDSAAYVTASLRLHAARNGFGLPRLALRESRRRECEG